MPDNIFISSISAGIDFSMFLTSNGMLYAYGENHYGELGLNDFESR